MNINDFCEWIQISVFMRIPVWQTFQKLVPCAAKKRANFCWQLQIYWHMLFNVKSKSIVSCGPSIVMVKQKKNFKRCFKPYLFKIQQATIARITKINLFDILHWTSFWQFRPITADEYHDSWETLWVSGFLLSKFHCFRAACQLLEEERKFDTPSLDRDAKKIVWCMNL